MGDNYGKKSISPILLLVVDVVVVVQFQTLYLKNCKRYRSEISRTRVGSDNPMCNDLSNVCKQCSLRVNNNKATPIIHYKGEILHTTGYS